MELKTTKTHEPVSAKSSFRNPAPKRDCTGITDLVLDICGITDPNDTAHKGVSTVSHGSTGYQVGNLRDNPAFSEVKDGAVRVGDIAILSGINPATGTYGVIHAMIVTAVDADGHPTEYTHDSYYDSTDPKVPEKPTLGLQTSPASILNNHMRVFPPRA